MSEHFEILQSTAFQCGYKVIQTAQGELLIVPLRADREHSSHLLERLGTALNEAGIPSDVVDNTSESTSVWSEVVSHVDKKLVSVRVLIDDPIIEEKAAINMDLGGVVLIVLVWTLGVMVSPGWWKLGALLGLPPFYFALEFVIKALSS